MEGEQAEGARAEGLPPGCCECTDNTKALLTVITLFASITIAQLWAAVAANSDTLLVDGLSMLVDTSTYVGNLVAEFRGGGAFAELLASGASLAVLYGVALYGVLSAAMELGDPIDEQEHPLEPGVVLAFGIWGLVFDLLSFWGFHRWGLQSLVSASGSGEEDDPRTGLNKVREEDSGSQSPGGEAKPSMNMRSAFMHVGADLLRSSAAVVEGCVVIFAGGNGRSADAIATLVVSATIIAGGCGAGASWLREAWKVRYTRRRQKMGLSVPVLDNLPAAILGTPVVGESEELAAAEPKASAEEPWRLPNLEASADGTQPPPPGG
uniref:Cation efflux protein transmembrane domain-containing protein n=1 Tax=Alexandrium monilatum TaxID=311494 RepID=A0A7S4W366_9DINO